MMNAKSVRVSALLALLAVSAIAADRPEPDPAARTQLEEKLHSANDKLNEAAREISELSAELYGGLWSQEGSRAILGINVGTEASNKSDNGVRVFSVSPGGPAAVAGIKPNDVIVAFQGKKLQTNAGKSPRQQLLVMTREVEPNSTVAVDVERDGKVQTVKVIPKGMTIVMDDGAMTGLQEFGRDIGKQFSDKDFVKQFEGLSDRFDSKGFWSAGGFWSAEFLELTPGLGRYFGTDKGLLVVRPPKDANLKLEEGDVILDIDGRVPTDASHALRILNSYRAGETMKLHIMRQQKRIELPVELRAEKLHAAMAPPPENRMATRGRPAHDELLLL
jgi:C-terminal processing protease CtpA/Prc